MRSQGECASRPGNPPEARQEVQWVWIRGGQEQGLGNSPEPLS